MTHQVTQPASPRRRLKSICLQRNTKHLEDTVIDQIRAAVHTAAGKNQKIAMFHFQVLKNAKELDGLNPREFCKEIGVPASYGTEFTKMISLARVMSEQGMTLV